MFHHVCLDNVLYKLTNQIMRICVDRTAASFNVTTDSVMNEYMYSAKKTYKKFDLQMMSYLIVVSGQLTDKPNMFLSNLVHSLSEFVLRENLVISIVTGTSPFLFHGIKMWAHLNVAGQANLNITKQRNYW